MTSSRYRPLVRMSLQYSCVFFRAERAEHAGFHDLRKADDGVERRAQLVAHVGEELRLGAAGFLGAVFFLAVFLREDRELQRLRLQRLLRRAQVGDGRHLASLAVHQLFFVQLDRGDVGADRHVAAVLGALFADVQPAAVVEPDLEGARAERRGGFVLDLLVHHRLAAGRDDLIVAVAGADGVVGQIVQIAGNWSCTARAGFRRPTARTLPGWSRSRRAGEYRRRQFFSTRLFCSVTSTAMPIRCGPASPSCGATSQRARSHTQWPLRVTHAEFVVDRSAVAARDFGGELVEVDVVGMHEFAEFAEGEQCVARR